jgi:hypothetical protein
MKKILTLLALLLSGLSSAQEPQAPPLTVAVINFATSDEKLQPKTEETAVLLSAALSSNPQVWMVEREDIDKILAEQTLKLSGLTDAANVVSTGRLLGAQVLVTGRLVQSGNNLNVVAKIISTSTSRVFGETVKVSDPGNLQPALTELSEKISKLLVAQRAVFDPVMPKREERIARLREALHGKKLPSVSISIPEESLPRPVVDPAVETEFGKVILELGGTVIDPKSGQIPEVRITGEAFSQLGARRGQLIAARARIEIKATRSQGDAVIATDRETGVAVDIADAVAGKTALQETALTLAERVLPQLVGS